MGVYIPGIEMPKGHNYVTITIWPSGAASSVLFDREGILRDFKDFRDIKVAPVPPHGRLGDLDNIVKVMLEERNRIAETYGENDEYVRCLEKYAISIVTESLTIIPADKPKEDE